MDVQFKGNKPIFKYPYEKPFGERFGQLFRPDIVSPEPSHPEPRSLKQKLIDLFFPPAVFRGDWTKGTTVLAEESEKPKEEEKKFPAFKEPTPTPTFAEKPKPTPTPITRFYRNPEIKEGLEKFPDLKSRYGRVSPIIQRAATKYNVPVDLLTDISFAESGFDPNNEGPTQDMGLFQFIPGTWRSAMKRMGLPENSDRKNPELSTLATAYLISIGELGHWDHSKWKWGKYYTDEELKRFYGL